MNIINKKYVTDCKDHNEFYDKYHKHGSNKLMVMDKVHYELNGEDFIPTGFSTTGHIVWYKREAA